jgi:DNA processing protein
MENDRLYQLALSRVEGVGPVFAKRLIEYVGDAGTIFRTSRATLEKVPGIRENKVAAILNFNEFSRLEKELAFWEKFAIRPLFFTDKEYPQRLVPRAEAPILLFYKGNADLNAPRIIAVIGTRDPTDHGKQITDTLIRELAFPGVMILSGLAYGIDAASHKAALKYKLPTVGVLGHGLDRIYPGQHRKLAAEMLYNGGLLTEYCTQTKPDTHHFPSRNRIVAGMCDALVVVETGLQGGSLLTVENARKYGKKIFAIPGRIMDSKSSGCNRLIRTGEAALLTDGQQLMEAMGWLPQSGNPIVQQTSLFADPDIRSSEPLSHDERSLLDLIRETGPRSVDELAVNANLNNSAVSAILLNLELAGLITSMPGRVYRLAE